MALVATGRSLIIGRIRGRVRAGRLLVFTALSAGLVLGALRLPPFLPAGADLANQAQRLYAENLWSQVQLSLVLVGCFLPWLTYALLWRGAARGAAIVAGLALSGTVLATWVTVITVGTYAALPASVVGVVTRVDGRSIQLAGASGAYYLALSDEEMASSSTWLKPGSAVMMWVSRRGQVGAIEAVATEGGAG
ncbi:MAG TPA: hypothetical protein VGD57_02100 [Candidatus Dormibacteraeota bacterium]|jgi:hypothetical protein